MTSPATHAPATAVVAQAAGALALGFAKLNLLPELLRAVAEQGYTDPTPIQAQAIPVVLAGRDLLAAAQTGTGKTAGFTLPLLQRLQAGFNNNGHARKTVRALILVPTRELAAQVQDSVKTYGKFLRMPSTTVYGGVGFHPQVQALRRGVEILVATPGRLLDHIQQRTVDLSKVEILVLDEADRMLDMGFIHDIRRILALLPKQRQNLLFSATFSEEIRTLSAQFLTDPALVEVARRNAPIELVTQVVHPVDKDRKRELLAHLVKTGDWHQVLVFCKTKHGADRLSELLQRDGIEADAIHGNKSQPQRMRALKRFKDNELQVLVATDIAARGIDIDSLPHVVNYDLPHVSEDYVHRIGRTGRAGSEGDAVSLVCGEDRPLLRAIERLIAKDIPQKVIPGFEPTEKYHSASAPKGAPRRGAGRPGGNNRNANSRGEGNRSGGNRSGTGAGGNAGNGARRSFGDRSEPARRSGPAPRPGNAPRKEARGANPGNRTAQPLSWEAERNAQVEHFRKAAREDGDGAAKPSALTTARKAA